MSEQATMSWAEPDEPWLLPAEADQPECRHDSMSGDEGPIKQLGRWPTRWRCDNCGFVKHDSGCRCDHCQSEARTEHDAAGLS